MKFVLQPWQLLVVILVSWIQPQQQAIIEFQNEQIRSLLAAQGKKRVRLTDDQRRRLAVKGKALGRRALSQSDTTVGNLLKANGIEPAPDRQRKNSWKTFLKAHWEVLVAVDFTTVEVWTKTGLANYYLLFAMRLVTRRVYFAGMTLSPHSAWMQQVARNLTDSIDGFLNHSGYLFLDRDTKYSDAFCELLRQERIKIIRLPPRSPNLNAHLERFIWSIKSEALERMIFFGEHSLRTTVKSYLEHYHRERNHQGLGNQLIEPAETVGTTEGKIVCHQRLGGILRYYDRQAA
jgi:putative transposase